MSYEIIYHVFSYEGDEFIYIKFLNNEYENISIDPDFNFMNDIDEKNFKNLSDKVKFDICTAIGKPM